MTLPSADPFYRYSGKTPLAQVAPGSILLDSSGKPAERTVDLAVATATLPLPTGSTTPVGHLPLTAEQVLYRTADETGRPTATVTTILEPATGAVDPKIVAYLSFYDSLSSKCDPSYTLQGGDPNVGATGTPNSELTELEQGLVQAYAADDVVTVPDFEGESLDWTAGHEAGYGTLDAIRATEAYLAAPLSTPVGLTGYSGGSIAADWASELQPTYAKDVNLVGVAEGGIPVDFAHNLTYINGDQDWASIIPAVLDTLSHVYGIDLSQYLSAYGMKVTAQDQDECIGEFNGTVPGLTVQMLLKPQYANFLAIPAFATVVNKLIMGTVPGTPDEPLYMAVGNDPDRAPAAEGDDIMVTADVEALAHEYCTQHVPVHFQEFTNADHENAALEFEPAALAFLQQRLAGAPFTPDACSSIPVGNSLAPISPAKAITTTATTTSTATAAPTPASSVDASASTRTAPVGGTGTLAFTGTSAAPAIAALVLLGAGGTVAAVRRRR